MQGQEQHVRIRTVQVLDGYHVRLEFTNGQQKEIDLEPYLHGPVLGNSDRPIRFSFRARGHTHGDHRLGQRGGYRSRCALLWSQARLDGNRARATQIESSLIRND